MAVQLAHGRGAYVIGTASVQNLEFVRELGADEVVDYKATPFEKAVRDIDFVFDTVGGTTLERSWSVLKPGGRLVTIATQSQGSTDKRVQDAFFVMEPNRPQLTEIARLIDARKLRPIVAGVFPLAHASAAYGYAKKGHLRGKIVLRMLEVPTGANSDRGLRSRMQHAS